VVRSETQTITSNRKEFYQLLKNHVGQKVVITYSETYQVVSREKNGKKEVIQRSLVGRHLLNVCLK
jgi:hypothetical protein